MVLTRLTTESADIKQVNAILQDAYSGFLRPYLIYSDPNYYYFLTQIVNKQLGNFFYIAKDSLQVLGFVHLKVDNENLFLNNIAICENQRKMGLGRKLLDFAIKDLLTYYNLAFFSLDVFNSNQKALNWYERMGLRITNQKYWYDATNLFISSDQRENVLTAQFERLRDENGFEGIYVNNSRLATIIDNTTLIFRDFKGVNFLSKILSTKLFNKYCLITDQAMPLGLIDTSLRLSVEMENLNL